MIKRVLLVSVGLLCFFIVNARKIQGVIIFSDDTMNVVFEIPSDQLIGFKPCFESLQYRVNYYDVKGERRKLKPAQAREIRFTLEGREIRMLSRILPTKGLLSYNKNIFLHILIDGDLKLYNYYYTEKSINNESFSEEDYILQKGEGELMRPQWLFFRRDMIEYFNDCLVLSHKINNREYNYEDIEQIVSFYNSHCEK